jgi:hypothetical protein
MGSPAAGFVVCRHAVAELGVDAAVERRCERCRASHRAQRDVHDIVGQSSSVREARQVAAKHAETGSVSWSAG